MTDFKKELPIRMDKCMDSFHHELSGLRTGRASVSLLEPLKVEAYGSYMPVSQIGTVSAPEPRMITVQVWDKEMVKPLEKAIQNSGLGLNPMTEGTTLRIPIPPLNEERRQELAKMAGKYAEETRISIRNIRREAMDSLKKQEKDGDISEDEHRKSSDDVQKLTDQYIKKIDDILDTKQKDIMNV
jgi:ribosome recycling factor